MQPTGNTSPTCATATAPPAFPVYFFHTLDKPFCTNPSCQCQRGRLKTLAFLEAVEWGAMRLSSVEGDVCRNLQ
jgi:hypothetical protein